MKFMHIAEALKCVMRYSLKAFHCLLKREMRSVNDRSLTILIRSMSECVR